MRLSQKIMRVKPSATLSITAKAKAMRAEGIDVLTMSTGEPDCDTPDNIKQAAIAALAAGDTKYSPVAGKPALRQAVAKRVSDDYETQYESNQVIVGVGGKQVLFNACASLLDPGDEALFAAPYWVSYPEMINFFGAKPIPISVSAEDGFLPLATHIATHITEKTRLLILNSPSNPTGASYSREQLIDIAVLLREHPNIFVISDEIYAALSYDDDFVGLLEVAPDLKERTLIATGVSKAYAMTGWRVGFGIGPAELIAAMGKLQGASTSGACSIAQAAAIEAMNGPQAAVQEMREIFRARRDRICKLIAGIEGVKLFKPTGAFYVFPDVSSYYSKDISGSAALCENLLETVHLAIVPGIAFGADNYVRLSYACSDDVIDGGIERLAQGLKAL